MGANEFEENLIKIFILLKFRDFNNDKATKRLSNKIKSQLKYKNTGELYLIYPLDFNSINLEIKNFNKETKMDIFSIVSKSKLVKKESYELSTGNKTFNWDPYPEFLPD